MEIFFYLKPITEFVRFAVLAMAPSEFFSHGSLAHISDMADHAGHGKPFCRKMPTIVVATSPMRVCHDRLPAHFIEGNLLGGMPRRGGNDHGTLNFIRIGRNPFQGLHASHRTACHGEELINLQVVNEVLLHLDHVGNADDREIKTIMFPRLRVDGGGPVVPLQPPRTFEQMTKYLSVSKPLPGPIISSHQPGFSSPL